MRCNGYRSLIKQFLERKRESAVRKHFCYYADHNKSVCHVVLDYDKECGFHVSRKNTTNLKSHLQHHHADSYEQLKSTVEHTKSRRVEDKGKFW